MDFARRQRSRQELNVAPLIDVVFLLLIFFMLASTFIEPNAVDISLSGGNAQTVTTLDPLIVEVTTDGSVRLNGLRLSFEQLTIEIAARINGDPSRVVTIMADAETPVQKLIQVMDQVRSAGTNNLRLSAPELK